MSAATATAPPNVHRSRVPLDAKHAAELLVESLGPVGALWWAWALVDELKAHEVAA